MSEVNIKMGLEEYLQNAEVVIASLMKKFPFGYYDEDDIAQEARIYAMESYRKFDGARPPQPFLRRCLQNDLMNLFRKMCRRSDYPCKECGEGRPCRSDGELCTPFLRWAKVQNLRSSLMNTSDLSEFKEDANADETAALDQASENELSVTIDSNLSPSLRGDYLKMLAGVGIPNNKRIAVQTAIRIIIEEHMPCLAKSLR